MVSVPWKAPHLYPRTMVLLCSSLASFAGESTRISTYLKRPVSMSTAGTASNLAQPDVVVMALKKNVCDPVKGQNTHAHEKEESIKSTLCCIQQIESAHPVESYSLSILFYFPSHKVWCSLYCLIVHGNHVWSTPVHGQYICLYVLSMKEKKRRKKNLVIEKDEHCIHYFVPLLELCTNLNGCINIKKELIVKKRKPHLESGSE